MKFFLDFYLLLRDVSFVFLDDFFAKAYVVFFRRPHYEHVRVDGLLMEMDWLGGGS